MLTNQIIGAGQNVSSHTPRQNSNSDPVQPVAQVSAVGKGDTSTDQIMIRAVDPKQETQRTDVEQKERPPLELPKRIKMTVAVVDTIPDAVPESIYDAKVSDESRPQLSNPVE